MKKETPLITNYAKLSVKPKHFHALTGSTLEEFEALLPPFEQSFLEYMQEYTLTGKKRTTRRFVAYRTSPLPTIADKLVFILTYLRKATTQDLFGEVFTMPQPVVNKWLHVLHPCLNQALAQQGALPAREVTAFALPASPTQIFFQDGMARPMQRPKDKEAQRTFYSGKKKRHTLKNNVLVTENAKICLLTPTCEGKKHDKKICDDANLALPTGSYLYQDTGFQGFALEGVTGVQPKKKPRGKVLTDEEKENKRAIASVRIRVEHAICGIKRYRIVKDQLRNLKKGFRDAVIETCCGLHNFRLNFRLWHYDPVPIKS